MTWQIRCGAVPGGTRGGVGGGDALFAGRVRGLPGWWGFRVGSGGVGGRSNTLRGGVGLTQIAIGRVCSWNWPVVPLCTACTMAGVQGGVGLPGGGAWGGNCGRVLEYYVCATSHPLLPLFLSAATSTCNATAPLPRPSYATSCVVSAHLPSEHRPTPALPLRPLHATRCVRVCGCGCTQFGNGTLRLTTRQAYQLHGVLKMDLKVRGGGGHVWGRGHGQAAPAASCVRM